MKDRTGENRSAKSIERARKLANNNNNNNNTIEATIDDKRY